MTNETVFIVDPPIIPAKLKKMNGVMNEIRIKIYQITISTMCRKSPKALVLEQGMTKIILQSLLEEKLVVKGMTRSQIVNIFQEYMNKLYPFKKIIIIDQYIFPYKHDSDYLRLLIDILIPYMGSLSEICFITKHHNIEVFNQFKKQIRRFNRCCRISLKENGDFHDRFWVFDDTHVLLVGTSLNGLGKTYCLIDKVKETDSRDLIAAIEKIP